MEYEFDINDLVPIGVTLVVTGIVLAFGLQVLGNVKDDVGISRCADRSDVYTRYNTTGDYCQNATGSNFVQVGTADYNATTASINGVAKLPDKLPLIATVIVAVIIIGILLKYFMNK